MMTSYTEQDQKDLQDEEINIAEVVDFFYENWKKALLSGVISALIGVAAWSSTPYKSEAVLINNGSLSFLSWRNLQKNLPLLASQLLELNKVPEQEISSFYSMKDLKWWVKNVVPTYSLTKSDTKDLASISKDLQESGGSNILNLVVTTTGSNKEQAQRNSEYVTKFIKSGLFYLSAKNTINRYEADLINSQKGLTKSLLDSEIELKYLMSEEKFLRQLAQEFPGNVAAQDRTILDVKDSRYLPLSTQLIAIKINISKANESLQRMHDRELQNIALSEFLILARQILEHSTDGLEIADKLIECVEVMQKDTKESDWNRKQILNNLDSELVALKTSYTKGLDLDLLPVVTRKGPLNFIAGGFLGGSSIFFIYAIVSKMLSNARLRLSTNTKHNHET